MFQRDKPAIIMTARQKRKLSEHRGNVQIHANNRALQRLGIHFNRSQAYAIIAEIKDKKYGKGVESLVVAHRLWYNITDIGWALYDSKLNRIVTWLSETPNDVLIRKELECKTSTESKSKEI